MGSSKMSRAGSPKSAMAMPMRCFIPSEQLLNFILALSSMRTIFKTRPISPARSLRPKFMVCIMRLSHTEELGKHPAFSIKAPTRLRTPASV